MSEQSPEYYDPMSLRGDVDEIYTSSEVLELIRAQRSITQETTRYQPYETVRLPDLPSTETVSTEETQPPIAP